MSARKRVKKMTETRVLMVRVRVRVKVVPFEEAR
jgi:hypothetical protein